MARRDLTSAFERARASTRRSSSCQSADPRSVFASHRAAGAGAGANCTFALTDGAQEAVFARGCSALQKRSALREPLREPCGGTPEGSSHVELELGPLRAAEPPYVRLARACEDRLLRVPALLQRLEDLQQSTLRIRVDADEQRDAHAAASAAAAELEALLASCAQAVELVAKAPLTPPGTAISAPDAGGRAARVMRSNFQLRLAGSVQDAVVALYKSRRRFEEAYARAMHVPDYAGSAASASSACGESGIAFAAEHDEGFTQAQLTSALDSEHDTNSRLRDIARVSESTRSLAQLFQHLHVIISEQSIALDHIDALTDTAVRDVKSGTTHLQSAESHQKQSSACTFWCIVVLVVLIVACVILIAVKHAPAL